MKLSTLYEKIHGDQDYELDNAQNTLLPGLNRKAKFDADNLAGSTTMDYEVEVDESVPKNPDKDDDSFTRLKRVVPGTRGSSVAQQQNTGR